MIYLVEEVQQETTETYKQRFPQRLEARVLGLSPYFTAVYGARDNDQHTSKHMILDSILADNHFSGPERVVFGDGYAEIKDAHAAGAITVGVASDEITRRGVNPVKRSQLLEAGADLIISDYRCHEMLLAYLFNDVG